ncbi:threonylcarbamoyl-AMP synthase [Actinobacillus succinogenes]|uniref:Threonylcarbamoyl-AMP synthase n=1 Tax=Actinobacillus succinogenes (strain ATCC 55618 / DSM 22257 / CCUG 43843 / 130Z) TaxID=339671 RepID=TSAC_ACTSZ|nr:Sua5/YciO/YrdC/YwlC family protein [Actinobacillus succinogenes]A6VL69.1 RecName: Full=Threonylcarbamoyl-AMP synthase; Short=TC-AMP synthase; AltName: Full=L-threonylcarbamoyladenylate synthase; AltName: Full=t(6)A37 threonylcarbamoyladenosine biosynthesis protein TsaC; AltName: Full=tRNA threonylcarbamoyladenosine biosynthesis protein TsaC [Actinobacillus succinogenes 130Z]ABR73716.1 SUA5/yciO/yrdC domain [Actinobacillus succinogenes 130Z]PHI39826.1 threonylcarbamoyl-AMP synthase [Actinobaci
MNFTEIAEKLKQNQVVAYPTEAVFGLGCNPLSESAVKKLLDLKQRPIDKGLILIAPDLLYLLPFIDTERLNSRQISRLTANYSHPVTWVVPVKFGTPKFLTGRFNSIAVRISDHPAVAELCSLTGFALTSTSANLSGLPPCKTAAEVRSQFGQFFPVLDYPVGHAEKPSEIRNLLTDQLIREG